MWIIGEIERTYEKKIFLCEIPYRKHETLLTVIQNHVYPGTIIYTDFWKGYLHIETILISLSITLKTLYLKDI